MSGGSGQIISCVLKVGNLHFCFEKKKKLFRLEKFTFLIKKVTFFYKNHKLLLPSLIYILH